MYLLACEFPCYLWGNQILWALEWMSVKVYVVFIACLLIIDSRSGANKFAVGPQKAGLTL